MLSTHLRNLFLSALVVGSVVLGACSEEDPSFDNKGACENFIESYNALDCTADVQIDPSTVCGGYTDTTVNCSAIFNCWADNLECQDLGGIEVPNNYTEGCPTSCV